MGGKGGKGVGEREGGGKREVDGNLLETNDKEHSIVRSYPTDNI